MVSIDDDLEALAIKSANRYYNLAVMRGKALTVLIDGNHIRQESLEELLAELYDLRFQNNILKEKEKTLSAFRETEKKMKEGKACYMCGSTKDLFFDGDGIACKECHKPEKKEGITLSEPAIVHPKEKSGTKEPIPKKGKTDPKKLEEDIYNLIKFTKKATRKEIMESLKLKSSLISSLLFKLENGKKIVSRKKDKFGTKEYSIAETVIPKEKKIDHEKIAKAMEIDIDYNVLREMFWDAYNKDKRIGKKMLMKAIKGKDKAKLVNDFLSKIYYDLEYRERIEANTGFHISVMIGQKGLEDCIMLTSMIDIPA